MFFLSKFFAQDRVHGPVRCLARGAAVHRDLASRALLGPLVAFVIGNRLARRVITSSGALLICLGLLVEDSNFFLGRGSMATKDERLNTLK